MFGIILERFSRDFMGMKGFKEEMLFSLVQGEAMLCIEQLSNGEKNICKNLLYVKLFGNASPIHDVLVHQHINSWQTQLQDHPYWWGKGCLHVEEPLYTTCERTSLQDTDM